MEPLNEKLLRLINLIKEQPTNSRLARKAKNQLFKTIQAKLELKSPRIFPRQDKFLIEDARQQTYLNITKYLHTYNPEKAEVMIWVEKIFKREFYKLLKKHRQAGITEVPEQQADGSEEENKLEVASLNALNYDPAARAENKNHRLLREFISEDPEGIFQGAKTTNNVTLQQILLMRLNDKKWQEIEDKFKISKSTASAFYSRSFEKSRIRNYFHKYLS